MTKKTITRTTGAALLATGLVLGASTTAVAATADPEWDQKAENWGEVLSASISSADRTRLADAGVLVDDITINGSEVTIEWSVDDTMPFPAGIDPIDPADPWGGHPFSMMLGVHGNNVYEPGKYSSGAPAGTFSSHVPLGFVFNADGASTFSAASLSSWRVGSPGTPPATESWNIDQYQTFDPAREAAAEDMGLRGHYLPNLSECYDNSACGIWIQPATYGQMETEAGLTTGMYTLTDPIWVSVRTQYGLKTPADYVDAAGFTHTFSVGSTHPGAEIALSTAWNTPGGVNEDGSVSPRIDLLHPFYRSADGTIASGVRASVPVTQTVEALGWDSYRVTITPESALSGSWTLESPAFTDVFYVYDDEGNEFEVVTATTMQGQNVVIDFFISDFTGATVPALSMNAPFLNIHTGAVASNESFWMTPGYIETLEAPEDTPVVRRASLNFEVQVENTYGGTLAPEDIAIDFTGTTEGDEAVAESGNAYLFTTVTPGSYAVVTPEVEGYVFSGWDCTGIGWHGSIDTERGEFIAEPIPADTDGTGMGCVRVYTELPPATEPPVDEPPVVEPPVEEPPVFNEPFRPETGVETNGVNAAALAALAALLSVAGAGLLLRARRQD